MRKLIIELCRGILSAVYSDSVEPLDIQVIDDEDRHDEERAANYHQIQRLIEHGCLIDIYNDPVIPDGKPNDDSNRENNPLRLSPNAFLLVPEPWEAKTENGRLLQKLDTAFIDGLLNAWGRFERFILSLNRSQFPEEREVGATLLRYLEPVRRQMNVDYDAFCKRILESETYDRAVEESEKEV